MKQRNPILVFLFGWLTGGIYSIYWWVATKSEMNAAKGTDIPTAWLIIVPIANLWWMWKVCEGVGKVTNNQMSGGVAFVLLFLLGPIGAAVVQSALNKVAGAPPAPAA